MLREGGEENSLYHAFAAPFNEYGTERGMSSMIKSGQKGTEASIIQSSLWTKGQGLMQD